MKVILSIDGGGIRGYVPAYILNYIQSRLSRPLIHYIDLIAGTSTGGIIATGLSIPNTLGGPKYSTQDLVSFYKNDAGKIFKNASNLAELLFRSKYRNQNLTAVVGTKMGDVSFSDLMTNVLIPTYCITDRRPYFFKSWKDTVEGIPASRVVEATCSAPIFFDPTSVRFPNEDEVRYFIDGALVANNPTMCAYVEAKKLWGDEDVLVLSLGCGDISNPISADRKKRWGILPWIPQIVEIVTDAGVNSVDYQLRVVNSDMYVRLQTKIVHAAKSMDDASLLNMERLRLDAHNLIEERTRDIEAVVKILEEKLDSGAK